MSVFEPSHAVAVTGYVYEGGRFLLLKRTTPPLIWAPPGGRLLPGEDPLEGVLREVGEETGLRGRVLGLVDYWFGEIADRGALLSLDFVLSPESDSVRLSEEHEAFVWATLEDMKKGSPDLGDAPWCYDLGHFEAAERKAMETLENLSKKRDH
ncbi:MAG: NUDIX domain-containing protein [Candidatus Omnitrophica bacterium]|nr:NUDIX domain-containing protein [Candidatus Omnitrophota bacterium]MCA9429307.1 NUDIX domain-containing protein [Candidatus Omnitrophota bacterium]MCA9446129.1 NUDIX domain-containing protein [Candidatus Omnitrophota bacterium]